MQRTPPNKGNEENCTLTTTSPPPPPKRSLEEISPEFPPHKMTSIQESKSSVGNMSVTALKSLIMGSMSSLLDEKLKDLPTKSDLEGIGEEIHKLQQKNLSLQDQLQKMESRCISLERHVEWLSKKANEKNIIFHVPAINGEVATDKAKSLCLDLLETQNTAAISSARLIKSRNPKVENIIVELHNREDVGRILQSAVRLRGTGISVHKDYPAAARERRRRVIKLRDEITSKNPRVKSYLRGETLKIQDKIFYFDINNNLSCDEEGGMSLMEQLLNVSDETSSHDAVASGSQSVNRNDRIQRF